MKPRTTEGITYSRVARSDANVIRIRYADRSSEIQALKPAETCKSCADTAEWKRRYFGQGSIVLSAIESQAVQWTREALEQKIRNVAPKVAVFDCDGTLWGGDAGLGFMTWTLEQGIVSRSTSDWIDTRHRAY